LESNRQGARLVLPIDQPENVFRLGSHEEGSADAGDRFLEFLTNLLRRPEGRVLVVATMRTDFLVMFEGNMSYAAGLRWQPFQLEHMAPSRFGEVIDGPAVG
jgi:broad specificity phosphatase PhoE